jgi:hypothetical protein
MAQRFLSLRNFEKYQSMKYSTAPWFKVQHKIFGDRDFIQLPYNLRYLMFGLIHLAVETNNKIYNDPTWIGQRLYMNHTDIDLKPLYRCGFLVTSNLSRDARVELSRVEKSRVEGHAPVVLVDFDTFWKEYPRKVSKQQAVKAWRSLNPDHTLLTTMLQAIEKQKRSEQWQKDQGKFIPHAATWLNGKRWEDELAPKYSPPEVRKPAVIVDIQPQMPTIGKDEASIILKRLGMTSVGEL